MISGIPVHARSSMGTPQKMVANRHNYTEKSRAAQAFAYDNTAEYACGILRKNHALISSLFLTYTKYACEKLPSSEPDFSWNLLLPHYALLPSETPAKKWRQEKGAAKTEQLPFTNKK
jgi:hypothetical protein